MFEQLKAHKGKNIIIELVNGRIIAGTVLSVDENLVRMETAEGVGAIPVSAVQIVWDSLKRSLTGEDMEQLADQLKAKMQPQMKCSGVAFNCQNAYSCVPPDLCAGYFSCPGTYTPANIGGSECPKAYSCGGIQFKGLVGPPVIGPMPPVMGPYAGQDPKAEIACTGFPGFSCAASYICRPPDTCSFSFACPGSYAPSFPSGGGACPLFFCGSFQFGQPCGPFQFSQPCAFLFNCGSFQFNQPCNPFVFGQPCSPFIFGGSQCGTFGGFTCAGQQFFGAPTKPPTPCTFQFGGSQCGTVGGFTCAGQQFFGVAPMTGKRPQEAPLPPTDFAVHEPKKDKE